jgi:hypothetical protein
MTDPTAAGRRALALVAASVGLVALTAFLGPSVATRAPGRPGALPPYDLRLFTDALAPSPWLVVALLAVATAAGVAGLLAGRAALTRGWAPNPRRLLAGGLLAAGVLLLVPPATSDDLYSNTAYGRMVALGRDPYTTTPNDVPGDPVVDQAGAPWRDVPSVYGPAATGVAAAALRVAGRDVRTGAALLALASALAYALTAVLLDRAAPDDAGRRRAALLWTLNPFVLVHLVAGAHVDALLVACAVAAVLALRRSPLAAGALAGAAVCVKLSGALTAAALAWTERRRPRRLLAVAAGGFFVTAPSYLLVGGWSALGPVRRASRFVSFGSPWRALSVPLDHFVGSATSRAAVSALSLLAVAALCGLLGRALPGEGTPRTAAVLALAWLAGATYVLPWYDTWAWPFVALLPASRWDRWLAVRTALLTVAYLPGRIEPMPRALADLLSATRLYVTPVVLGLLAVVAVRWCRESA